MSTTSFRTAEHRARAAEQRIPLARSRNDALEATINAAELYLQALRLVSSGSEKARLDSKCKELLTKAERVKEEIIRSERDDEAATSSLPSSPVLQQPTSKRRLTTREEIVILEGSRLNGFTFLPWKDDPTPEELAMKEGQEPFVDSPSLQLSPLQLKTFAGWKRPWEAFGTTKLSEDGVKLPQQPTMRRMKKMDLVQDMTSDCSVVASLCAGSARAERGHPRVRR
jgi:calpain-7